MVKHFFCGMMAVTFMMGPFVLMGADPVMLIGSEIEPVNLNNVEASTSDTMISPETKAELQKINEQQEALEKKLEIFRKNELNAEMNAQPLMFDNWHEYADKIKLSEDDEKRVLAIKEQISKLQKRKQELLKSNSTSPVAH